MEYRERNGSHGGKFDSLLNILEIIEPEAEVVFGLLILVAIFLLVMWIVEETTERARPFATLNNSGARQGRRDGIESHRILRL